jgi:lysophospholipase
VTNLQTAPFFADLADGPEGGEAFWLSTADGPRIRAAVWPKGAKGTVLLFPGRTEYVEKYGRAAADLALRGYATLSVDWRGQGLADRALADRMAGHVEDFAEFQQDVQACLGLARHLGLPEPFYLISHSMGGCIALRALMSGLKVKAAAFSAPMWGISMAAWMRPLASAVAEVSGWFGQTHRFAPGTSNKTYVAEAPFVANVLTTDADMWAYMRHQVQSRPELSLGGPSLGWLRAALAECHALSLMPAPAYPVLTALGTAEKVVDAAPIHLRMAGWRDGKLDLYPNAEHEVMMETPAHRAHFFDSATALFDANR